MSSENGVDELAELRKVLTIQSRTLTNQSEQIRLLTSGLREDLGQLNGGILVVSAALARIEERQRWDIANISAEELADRVPHETINRARSINWARKKGEAEPLPPAPANLDEDTDRFQLVSGAGLELSKARQKQIVGLIVKLFVAALVGGAVYLAGLLHGTFVH